MSAEKKIEQMDLREVSEIKKPEIPGPVPYPMEDGRRHQEKKKQTIVKGKDTQGPANVEVAEAMFGVSRVVKNAGDQEAGENEEDIDAGPSPTHAERISKIVLMKYKQYRNGAQAVQGWIELLVFRKREVRDQIGSFNPFDRSRVHRACFLDRTIQVQRAFRGRIGLKPREVWPI